MGIMGNSDSGALAEMQRWSERIRAGEVSLPEAFRQACAMCQAGPEDGLSGRALALYEGGLAIAAEADREGPSPAYHDRRHFAESVIAAGMLAREEFKGDPSGPELSLLLLSAMAGHDILHDGTVNAPGKMLEAISAARCAEILRGSGVGEGAIAIVQSVILGTEFGKEAGENKRRYGAGPLDALRTLANEADIAFSCHPAVGPKLGELLAREWEAIGHPAAKGCATWKGRLFFLESAAGELKSRAAGALGLEASRKAQIEALRTLGADRLDGMEPEQARSRVEAALSAAPAPAGAIRLEGYRRIRADSAGDPMRPSKPSAGA